MSKEKYANYLNRVTVMLVEEPLMEYQVKDSNDISQLLQEYMKYFDREHFVAVFLNGKQRMQSIHEVSVGTLTASMVHPREVFKAAILANAGSIIIAHNHPSGVVMPSEEDIMVTERLKEVGKIIGIEVIDHLIIGRDSYYSFAENNM